MRHDRERLADILDAIAKIEGKTKKDIGLIKRDELVRVWVVHHLEILGEAARALGLDTKEKHSTIPWTMLAGIRNRLAHEYFRVDEDIVTNVV
jgi:uncharacterized protein with HEPN domain